MDCLRGPVKYVYVAQLNTVNKPCIQVLILIFLDLNLTSYVKRTVHFFMITVIVNKLQILNHRQKSPIFAKEITENVMIYWMMTFLEVK